MIQSNNRRIAKNSLALYLRMLIVMLLSLYTSRLILEDLGDVDYGIYNVVAGFVSLLSYINLSLSNSTQRFIIFSLGQNNITQLRTVFSSTLFIHLTLALIIVVACEGIGLWYINNVMVIPENKLHAAKVAFHCSNIALFFVIVSVPYYADIIAHEKMTIYAIISIVDVGLRLFIAIGLKFYNEDRLILYAILICVTQIIVQLSYVIYSKKHFKEVVSFIKITKIPIDKHLIKQIIAYTGWSTIGNLAYSLTSQGTNMVLNYFFGPIVNTARGLATQIQNAAIQFCNSFQTAINPQIIKNYAQGLDSTMNQLVFISSKFSFFLLIFLCIPIFVEAREVLSIWLVSIPPYLVGFVRFTVIIAMMSTLSGPFATAISATGSIKIYQIVIGGVLLLNVPISYYFLKQGFSPYWVYIIQFCLEIIAMILRIYLFAGQIHMERLYYFTHVIFKILPVFIGSLALTMIVKDILTIQHSLQELFIVTISSWILSLIFIFILGLTSTERTAFIKIICSRFNLKNKNGF